MAESERRMMSERFEEYVVDIDEGPYGVRGFKVSGVLTDSGIGSLSFGVVNGELSYDEAVEQATQGNRELGIEFPGPWQKEAFASWPSQAELRADGIVNGRVTQARKREIERLEEQYG